MKTFSNGYTLVEMLAAMFAAFVVLGAATGFMITALDRQAAIINAEQTESFYDDLADSIQQAVKTCIAFQIYPAAGDQDVVTNGNGNTSLLAGQPEGNKLVCLQKDGSINRFVFSPIQPNSSQGTIQATGASLSRGKPRVTAELTNSHLFLNPSGVVEASWTVETLVDVIPYDVYAVPLQWQ